MSKEVTRKYYLFNKPFGCLSQFTGEDGELLLGDYYNYPKDVYSVGRLDKDSEGLILLTNDNTLKARLLGPSYKKPKTYLVQVEGEITPTAIEQLSNGKLTIKHKGKSHQVLPAKCKLVETPSVWERIPPIRFRANIPTSWIQLTIHEGKNRQVRKMTAAVGFPTLRLIRIKFDQFSLDQLQPGEVKEIHL